MRRPFLQFPVAAVLLLASGAAPYAEEGAILQEGRKAYEARSVAGNARIAYGRFLAAAASDPESYEARWEGARAAYFLGEYELAGGSDDEKIELFEEALELAREAVSLNPDGVEGHFWLGVLYGVYGEARGIFKSLGLAPRIRESMELCLKLDPTVEGHGPDRVLGRLYFRLPWFKGGDKDRSLEHLRRSLRGCPENALTRLYLAETLRSTGGKREAIEMLRSLLSTDPDPRWAAEHPRIRKQAAKLLRKLE